MITQQQLQQIIPGNQNVAEWHQALEQILPDYEINTAERVSAYLYCGWRNRNRSCYK